MKWLLIYRLSSGQWPNLKAVHSMLHIYHRLTDGLPTWVEQSKDTCLWSTSSFPTIIYLGLNHFFSFFVIHILFSFTHIYSSSFIRCMLVVCMWVRTINKEIHTWYWTVSCIAPRCTGIWGALATKPPSGPNNAQEKSSRSLMLVDIDVRCNTLARKKTFLSTITKSVSKKP